MDKSIKIFVPASSANLGAGFDVIGACLDIWNEIKITEDLVRKKEKIKIDNFDLEIKKILRRFKYKYIPIIKVSYKRDYFKSNISNLDMNYDTDIVYERLSKNYQKISKVHDFTNIFEVKDNLYISPDSFLKFINHKRIRFSKYSEGVKKLNLS